MKSILRLITFAVFVSTLTQANAQCYYVAGDSQNTDSVQYSFSGGSFASFGCAPIDPTYWIVGSGFTASITFTYAEDYPAVRVWGMNDDDVASIAVNGSAYPLNESSAYYSDKVVCGQSPGPDGIVFNVDGNFTGANDNVEGNYSYQDLFINMTGVNTITITGISGAGWGFAGVTINCPVSVDTHSLATVKLYPNPTNGLIMISGDVDRNAEVTITNEIGYCVQKTNLLTNTIDISALPQGVYLITVYSDDMAVTHRILKL
ncbi:MAG: T9SS type A sorting domain-containing protein [Flavobacteriales bacterium]